MNAPSDLLNELRIDRSQETPPARRVGWIIGAIIVLMIAAAVAAFVLLRAEPLQVDVAQARAASAAGAARSSSVLDATGYVTARRQATVSAKITGKVAEVLIEEGQVVAKDEVLARLDPVDANAQLSLSDAQLGAARSSLAQIRAQLALADKTHVRNESLRERGLVSEAQLDQSLAERESLRAQLASAQQNVRVAQESLAVAAISVDNTVVRAPFAGVVTVKAAQPGEMISPISAGGGFTRTGIGTIVDMDSLEVQVDVSESFIGRVKAGQPVEAVLNAYPDWRIPAEVIAIVPTADRSKATVKVRIALGEKDPRIVPEMGVRVAFLEAAEPATETPVATGVEVPAGAVVERDGEPVVFVVREGRAFRQPVRAATARGGQRNIAAGLAIGETVVVAPPATLEDGAAVEIRP